MKAKQFEICTRPEHASVKRHGHIGESPVKIYSVDMTRTVAGIMRMADRTVDVEGLTAEATRLGLPHEPTPDDVDSIIETLEE